MICIHQIEKIRSILDADAMNRLYYYGKRLYPQEILILVLGDVI